MYKFIEYGTKQPSVSSILKDIKEAFEMGYLEFSVARGNSGVVFSVLHDPVSGAFRYSGMSGSLDTLPNISHEVRVWATSLKPRLNQDTAPQKSRRLRM